MNIIKTIGGVLSSVERWLLVVLLGVMVVLSFLQVFLRNAFSFGFLWADPLLRYMVMWVGFLGAALASNEEKHFGIDFLNRYLPPRWLHIVKTIVNLFACVVAFLLTRAAFQFLFEGIDSEEKDLFELPKRLYFAIIPFGFGLIAFHFLLDVINHVRGIFTAERVVEEEFPLHP
jgi:TRAP-type C4-dicarboxylate transport system permease small subunit